MSAGPPAVGTSAPRCRRTARWLGPLLLVAVLALVPLLDLPTGGLLPDHLGAPGSLQLLGLCLVFGALAMTYDLLFGFTGLMSFGHSLFFAAGAYAFVICASILHLSGGAALAVTLAVAVLLPLAIGAVSLRTSGIAFAMVTLAFAQAGAVVVGQDPWHATGGELGMGLSYARLPPFLVGVANTRYLYWLCLMLAVAVAAGIGWLRASPTGRVWQAIRENEQRVAMLGLRPYTFKLIAFVAASFLATCCGVVYLLLMGGASPAIASAEFTLSLLVMVVLGGAGTRWGALLGAVLYTWLDQRLGELAGSTALAALPAPLRIPLSQPLLILGVLFIVIVLFRPGGLAGGWRTGAATSRVAAWLRRLGSGSDSARGG